MDPERIVVPARRDERPLGRRLVGPLGVAALAVGACAYLAVVDPNQPGHYPVCPSRAIFGVDCPGCGGMRAMNCLLHGDVGAALDHNALILVFIAVAVGLWGLWLVRAVRGTHPAVSARQFRARTVVLISALVALLAFGVVRNFVPYLGSGLA
jgi:hypothetical protein